jgi:hypothetical protein
MDAERRSIVRGYLYGLLCGRLQVFDAIGGAEVIALPSTARAATVESLASGERAQDLKTVVRGVKPAELEEASQAARSRLTGKTKDDGSFALSGAGYEGQLLDVYVAIETVPMPRRKESSVALRERQVLFLGTYAPVVSGEELLLKLILPERIWCWLKRLADVWTIVGRVTACADSSVALGGVKVTAFDVDWLQDDNLGSDTTSSAGLFRIDYLGEVYRKGTWVDVELFGGPDVYFKIEDSTGQALLTESPARGRRPGRNNSGPCLCVDLCVDVPVVPGGEPAIPSLWTKIGIFTVPNDFDAGGYAGAAKYALSGAIPMLGSAPLRTGAGHPVEYRFLVSGGTAPGATAPNTDPPLPAPNFTRVVGSGAGLNLFGSLQVGQMVRYAPYRVVDIWAEVVDLDADGWLDVNRAIERTFIADPDVEPIDIPQFVYVDTDGLMGIDTTRLTTAPDVPAGAVVAGQAVPPANLIPIEKIAIRFEVREVIDRATSTFGAMPGNGRTLNSVVVNNNPAVAKLAMKEHQEGTPCDILHGTIHAAYTGYHPHLASMSLEIHSNDGSYSIPSLADPGRLPLAGNINPGVVERHNAALTIPAVAPDPPHVPLHKCTYLVTFWVGLRLHNGIYPVGDPGPIQTTFFFEP